MQIIMKKGVFRLLFAAMMLTTFALTGCIKEQYFGSDVKAYYVTARANSWQLFGEPGVQGCYIYQTFDFPEITERVVADGFVTAFFCGKNGETQLPYIIPYDEGYGLTENIYCDYTRGSLTFIIEASDFSAAPRIADIKFKVVVVTP